MKRTILFCGLWLGCLAGCHSAFTTRAPRGFVELDAATPYDFRATSADGVVIAARMIDHDPEGAPEFWQRAVENAMRQRGGYALLGSSELSVHGLRGKLLRFGHDEGNTPHRYDVILVVTHSTLYLLEAGGTGEKLDEIAPQITRWAASFRSERCAPFPFAFACRALDPSDQPAELAAATAKAAPAKAAPAKKAAQ
jgi:hypothetical protein